MQVYHFHNGRGGGVLSVIKNLIRFSNNDKIDNHVIHAVNTNIVPNYIIEHIDGATSQQLYYYTPANNFYCTCKALAKLLPDENAIIVAHDWIELGMTHNLGLKNRVAYYLHGDYEYYYNLAEKHEKIIDLFIPVAQNIAHKLKDRVKHRADDISYLRFPVPDITMSQKAVGHNIIFIGRLEPEKGYDLLPCIAEKMKEKYPDVYWHIIGTGSTTANTHTEWNGDIHVKFYGNVSNADAINLLREMQMLILPSTKEGMPVVVIEAMKAGVIPFVNDIEGGIQELVHNDETGYKIKENNINGYVEKMMDVIGNRSHAVQMQKNCTALANRLFDPIKNTQLIEDRLTSMFFAPRRNKHAVKIYGSRLDQPLFPNWLVKLFRRKRHPAMNVAF